MRTLMSGISHDIRTPLTSIKGYLKLIEESNDRFGKRPLDEKGIEKNIKNIMSSEMPEKEVTREYNNRNIDKQKNNSRFEESKTKRTKSRKNNNNNFDEGKLKTLKQASKLSSMFDEQDGGMLDYYDLTTERGRRGKKKKQDNGQERTKCKNEGI